MKDLEVLQSVMLPLSSLRSNVGQIPGLPPNPRSLDRIQLSKLKKSLKQNPEMLALREILVYQYDGENIVIGGNQRLQALQSLSLKDVPCKIIPPKTKPAKLRAYLILDNIEFGEWVKEMIQNDWDLDELDAMGMDDVEQFAQSVSSDIPDQEEKLSEPSVPTRKEVMDSESLVAMRIGTRSYLVSQDDATEFIDRANAYKEQTGSYAGFITTLFKQS